VVVRSRLTDRPLARRQHRPTNRRRFASLLISDIFEAPAIQYKKEENKKRIKNMLGSQLGETVLLGLIWLLGGEVSMYMSLLQLIHVYR
jgi:hypothetical protein